MIPAKPCADGTPPWFVGHWKDWHRGHGCDKDDGKPRSDEALTEIAQQEANAANGYLTDAELRLLRASTTSGNELLVRALDELAAWRTAAKMRGIFLRALNSPVEREHPAFDHSTRTTKQFLEALGFCVCAHCQALPEHEGGE